VSYEVGEGSTELSQLGFTATPSISPDPPVGPELPVELAGLEDVRLYPERIDFCLRS
jgi:hypothetical protein